MRHVLTKENFLVRKFCLFLFLALVALTGCQLQVRPYDEQHQQDDVVLYRYDRVESQYLTLADFAALHQMRTDYPQQTRTLIENVLQLGPVDDPDINNRLLLFFQDSTLQAIIGDVARQYEKTDMIEKQLVAAFHRLSVMLPGMKVPHFYTQIGSLDQSIVVSDTLVGISLDKYLGEDYPAYIHYGYTPQQRRMMTREYIVPDCLGFYLLSIFPIPESTDTLRDKRHFHMMKIQCVVNKVMDRRVFTNDSILQLEQFLALHPDFSTEQFLRLDSLPK